MKTSSATSLRSDLEAVVEQGYSLFERYPLRPDFDGRVSPIGDRAKIARGLASVQLRKAPIPSLGFYTLKAGLTMGDEDDFKHFLPRILEAQALHEDWQDESAAVEISLPRFPWRQWPDAEQRHLEQYFELYWRYGFQLGWWESGADQKLIELTAATGDPAPFLRVWSAGATEETLICLAEIILFNPVPVIRSMPGMVELLSDPETAKILGAQAEQTDDAETFDLFVDALVVLQNVVQN